MQCNGKMMTCKRPNNGCGQSREVIVPVHGASGTARAQEEATPIVVIDGTKRKEGRRKHALSIQEESGIRHPSHFRLGCSSRKHIRPFVHVEKGGLLAGKNTRR